ncbi:MAG: ATP synthase subunit I [Gammaproteobacteria bacterium]
MTRPGWQSSLIITVGLQWGVVLGASLLAGLAGFDSASSLLAGGLSVAGPNALLAVYLWLKSRAVRVLSIATFLAGELLKLAGTAVALYASARAMGERMVWPALVIGVIVALKGHWLAVWFTRND